MPIGDFYAKLSKNRINKFIINILGVQDLHSHIRLKPLLKFVEKYFISSNQSTFNVLEIGCGIGINGFEISKIGSKLEKQINYVGVDLSEEAVNTAKKIAEVFNADSKLNFSFYFSDAKAFLDNPSSYKFDIVLFIDVLEHLQNPEEIIKLTKEKMNNNGIYLVSVPTPIYPKIFGRKFHKKIGHLLDGYDICQLDNLFRKFKYRNTTYNYNTGIFSNIGCWLYYNILSEVKNKNAFAVKNIIFYPFKFLDIFNSPTISSSLFAVYVKDE